MDGMCFLGCGEVVHRGEAAVMSGTLFIVGWWLLGL